MSCEYDTSLYNRETVEGYLAQLQDLLDGFVADLDRPVREISVRTAPGTPPGGGLAEVVVRHGPDGARPVRVSARAVTVSGRDFHYRADAAALGPVRNRTWTVQPRAWRLTVPG